MPAYDRPIQFNLSSAPRAEDKKVAAVIQFNSTDMDRINAFLEKLQDRGIISSHRVATYNPDQTTPELYFP